MSRNKKLPDLMYRLTPGGGPPPDEELDDLVARAERHEKQRVWFASRYHGSSVRLAPSSRVIIFHGDANEVRGVIAQVLFGPVPSPDGEIGIYAAHPGFPHWWQLRNPRPLRAGLRYADIPGRSTTGKNAASTFDGSQAWVAAWDLGEDAELTLTTAPARPVAEAATS